MREFRIEAIRVSNKNAESHLLGMRSKMGGNPDWDQNDEIPKCPDCNEEMTFVAQIDSIAHDESHNPHRIDAIHGEQDFMFGDVGLIYVFFCFECLTTKSVFQCG